jgi:acyl-CoA thioester hydrolase
VRAASAYPHRTTITTRWKDNDVYGHVNNVEYYSFFDTVINAWLIGEGGLDPAAGRGHRAVRRVALRVPRGAHLPEPVEAGLAVVHLGRSSVRYEVGLFRPGSEHPAASGWFVHVFVSRAERRPVDIPAPLRAALERLQVPRAGDALP